MATTFCWLTRRNPANTENIIFKERTHLDLNRLSHVSNLGLLLREWIDHDVDERRAVLTQTLCDRMTQLLARCDVMRVAAQCRHD